MKTIIKWEFVCICICACVCMCRIFWSWIWTSRILIRICCAASSFSLQQKLIILFLIFIAQPFIVKTRTWNYFSHNNYFLSNTILSSVHEPNKIYANILHNFTYISSWADEYGQDSQGVFPFCTLSPAGGRPQWDQHQGKGTCHRWPAPTATHRRLKKNEYCQ